MATTNPSANMNLPIPGVGEDAGPQWATDLNTCLTLLDQHSHVPGYGVAITPAAMDINADLTMANNNLINARSVRLQTQVAVLNGASDLGCIYRTGVDLYYNDGSGNQVRLTQSGSVAGTSGSIGSLTAPATATYVAGSGTFVWQSDASKAAAMDGGAVSIRETNVASANAVTLQSPTALAASYALTFPTALPASTQYMACSSIGVLSLSSADSIATAMTSIGANSIAATRTRATGTSVAAGGVAISSSSSAFATTSTSFVDVTNLSVTIVTSGRPVRVQLMSDGNAANYSYLSVESTNVAQPGPLANFAVFRGATEISRELLGTSNTSSDLPKSYIPSSSLSVIDAVAAGTYVYKVQAKVLSTNTTARVILAKLVVYEL